jgi:hypothetical protein
LPTLPEHQLPPIWIQKMSALVCLHLNRSCYSFDDVHHNRPLHYVL